MSSPYDARPLQAIIACSALALNQLVDNLVQLLHRLVLRADGLQNHARAALLRFWTGGQALRLRAAHSPASDRTIPLQTSHDASRHMHC